MRACKSDLVSIPLNDDYEEQGRRPMPHTRHAHTSETLSYGPYGPDILYYGPHPAGAIYGSVVIDRSTGFRRSAGFGSWPSPFPAVHCRAVSKSSTERGW